MKQAKFLTQEEIKQYLMILKAKQLRYKELTNEI